MANINFFHSRKFNERGINKNGLNILTGETGAGKTLIIDSLQIISGGRFSKEMIRKGQDFSFVEASMYIPEKNDVGRRYSSIKRNICKSEEILAK